MIIKICQTTTEYEIKSYLEKYIKENLQHTVIIYENDEVKNWIERAISENNAKPFFLLIEADKDKTIAVERENIIEITVDTAERISSMFNKDQYKAIFLLEGMFVQALAGTGKTYVIENSILNKLVKNECTIEEIAVITFTNSAADEIKTRLYEIFEAYNKISYNENINDALINFNKASISTIDVFFKNILKDLSIEVGLSNKFKLYNNDNVIHKIISKVVEDAFLGESKLQGGKKKKNKEILDDYGFYSDNYISLIKEIINLSSFDYFNQELLNTNLIGDLKNDDDKMLSELLNCMLKKSIIEIIKYTDEKRKNEDAIPLKMVLHNLKKNQDKLKYSFFIKKLKYILIDEAQDCDEEQIELLENIKRVNKNCKVIYIGDKHQSIYSFRISNPGEIKKNYLDYEIKLKWNYRCGKKINEFTNLTVNNMFKEILKQSNETINLTSPKTANDGEVKIYDTSYENLINKDKFFDLILNEVQKIRIKKISNKKQGKSNKDSKIFILARTNEMVDNIANILRKNKKLQKVNATISTLKGGTLFKSQPVNDLLALLKYIDNKKPYPTDALNLLESGFAFFNEDITYDVIINLFIADKNKLFELTNLIKDRVSEISDKNNNIMNTIVNIFNKLPNKYRNDENYNKNKNLVIDILYKAFGSNKTVDFKDIIKFIENNASKGKYKTVDESNLDSDIVVLNMHTVKGLQADVVFTIVDRYVITERKDLKYSKNEDKESVKFDCKVIYEDNKIYICMQRLKKNDLRTLISNGYDDKFKRKIAILNKEEINLCYIAFTRARERLYVFANNSENNIGKYIIETEKVIDCVNRL